MIIDLIHADDGLDFCIFTAISLMCKIKHFNYNVNTLRYQNVNTLNNRINSYGSIIKICRCKQNNLNDVDIKKTLIMLTRQIAVHDQNTILIIR